MSVDKELDEYTTRGSEVHVDSVRDAFLQMYGPGEFIHSDANEGAAKVFDGWVRFLKAEAWDEGARSITGVNILDDAIEFETANNPYRDTK